MNWDDVRVFAAVASCKSINKAAQILKVTPGMVSRRLDDLESALDVRLFTRTSSGVVLTAAGEDMLDRALSMQRFAESIEDSVRGRDHKNEGVVTLRTPDGMAGYWIAPRLAGFIDENPKIRLTLDCGGITADMQIEPDLIVTAAEADAQMGDVIIPLATLHYLFLAAPSYLERHGNPASIASAVSDHSALRHIGQVSQRESWGPRARAIEELVQASLLTNSSAVIVAATVGGAGICAAPSGLCHIYPSLQIVGPEVSIPIRLWLITRRHALGSARVQRVALWLQALFDTKLNPWFRDEFIPPRAFAAELDAIDGRLAPAAEPPARARAPRRKRR